MAKPSRRRVREPEARTLNELQKTVLAHSEKMVTVRQDGVSTEMPFQDILVNKIAETAVKGGSHAQRLYVEILDDARAVNHARVVRECTIWSEYVLDARRRIVAALAAGRPAPDLVPHPNDILIDHETGVRIAGPIDQEEAERCQDWADLRDVLLCQDALDVRLACGVRNGSVSQDAGAALVLMHLANDALPERLQLSDAELAVRLLRWHGRSQRGLLKSAHQGGKRLGVPVPRGWVMPPVDVVRELLELLLGAVLTLQKLRRPRERDYLDAATEFRSEVALTTRDWRATKVASQ